ncbi:MAG: TRAP transporter permease [Nitriliruptoraceae bacterium]
MAPPQQDGRGDRPRTGTTEEATRRSHAALDEARGQIAGLPEELRAELEADIAHLEDLSFADVTPGTRDDVRATWRWIMFATALLLSGFHLYTAQFGRLPGLQQGSFHLGVGLALVFLLYPGQQDLEGRERLKSVVLLGAGAGLIALMYARGTAEWFVLVGFSLVLGAIVIARHVPIRIGGIPLGDVLLALLSLGTGGYVFWNWSDIGRAVGAETDFTVGLAAAGVLLVLVACQRVIGTPLTVVASSALVFAYFGQVMPGFLAHRGFAVERIMANMFLGTEAVFGTPIQVSSTFIYIFMIFAALLQRTGMERFFTQLAFGLTGWMTGGTAKVGVLTSAFSGTITGSSVANTVSNGAFTIPMMKKSGYSGEFAGAVEAASSTGGQLAPPIMGAAAFIMVEITGLPYATIIQAAIIPAILFFTAQFIVVHFESKKVGIMGLPRERLPKPRQLMVSKGYLLLPIVIIFVLLAQGRSPILSALYAVYAVITINVVVQLLAGLLGRWRDLEDKLSLVGLLEALVDAARIALPIIVACAAAGIVAGVITLTGVGLQLVGGLLNLAGSSLILVLVYSMFACLVLGIGLPTTANYVITATLVAPAITLAFFPEDPRTAVALLTANLFVYYYGIMADITPPVCLASYAASGIAQSNPLKTGVQSVKIAIGGFLLPYMFVFSPELLLQGTTILGGILAAISALIGMSAVGVAVVGYIDRRINLLVRAVLIAAGLALISADPLWDGVGLVTFGAIFAWQRVSGDAGRRRAARAGQAGTADGAGTTPDGTDDDTNDDTSAPSSHLPGAHGRREEDPR